MRSTLLVSALLAAAAAAAAVAGCGGASSSAAPTTTQPDASLGDAGGDDAAIAPDDDAGPDPHALFPAAHPPIPVLTFHGGRVLTAPKLVTVTFTGMNPTIRDYVRDFDDKIQTTAWWKTAMDGYGVGAGAGGGHYELADVFSNVTTEDFDLETYLGEQIHLGNLPMPDDQTVYMLYMPSAATINLDGSPSCSSFGGYHNSADVVIPPPSDAGTSDAGADDDAGTLTHFTYAVMMECYSGFGGVTDQDIEGEETQTASHELAEVATDPDVNALGRKPGYYMIGNDAWAPNQRGGEVGDLCEAQQGTTEGIWSVTKVWNAASAKKSGPPCVPDSNTWFFGAVPHTEVAAKLAGGAPNNDGYIVVKKGESRDIEIDVFSTMALPGPLTVVAGKSKFSASDPSQVGTIKGATLTLSAATAQNGDKLTLTIKVDPTAVSGQTRFNVRAILTATDYHSWPAILYIP